MKHTPEHHVQKAWPIWLFMGISWVIIISAEILISMRSGSVDINGALWRGFFYIIPIGVSWGMANALIIGFLRVMYFIPSWVEASAFWDRLRSGSPRGMQVRISAATFSEDKKNSLLLRVGGPGFVVIGDEEVVVTEWNGRFQRVLGPGRHALDRFEYVHSVLDLRQQEYRNRASEMKNRQEIIRLITRDGIEIEADVTIIYRIASDNQSGDGNPMTEMTPHEEPLLPTRTNPYPFSAEAVRRAAYCSVVVGPRIHTWKERTIDVTLDTLRQVAAQYPLDKLVYPAQGGVKPYHTLQDKMEKQARQKLRPLGVRLIHARIDRLGLPEKVTNQMIKHWVAPHERIRQVQLAQLQAELSREVELAQAAQNTAIASGIIEGMKQARIEGSEVGVTDEVVALRMASALKALQRRIAQRGDRDR